jgi:hypothetical protein
MAVDPLLGYDPGAYAGPATGGTIQTKEQWINYVSIALANQYYQGTAGQNGEFYWADSFWAANGLGGAAEGGDLKPEYGIANRNGMTSGMIDLKTQALATVLYNQGGAPGLPPTAGLKDLGPMLAESDRDRIAQATIQAGVNATQSSIAAGNNATDMAIANMQEAGASARLAQELASRMSIAQLQEAGESARNAARIAAELQMAEQSDATQRYGIDVGAAVNREDIAARERMSAADITSREKIAANQIAEQAREFDLGIAEDRRQFNTSALMQLLTQGVELSRRPVDWLAHQYWMNNMGIAVNQLNIMASAQLYGAIPPSGPSELGTVIGGPGAIDGDDSLAPGTAGIVPVSEAVQQNPGDANQYFPDLKTSPSTYQELQQEYGDVDRMVAQSQAEAIPATSAAPDSPVVQSMTQQAATQLAQAPAAPVGPSQLDPRTVEPLGPATPPVPPQATTKPVLDPSTVAQLGPARPPVPPGGAMTEPGYMPGQLAPSTRAGVNTGNLTDAYQNALGTGAPVPPAPMPASTGVMPGYDAATGQLAPPAPPSLPGLPATNTTPGDTGGIYTGPNSQAASTATGAVAPAAAVPGPTPTNTEGGYSAIIQAIATALGLTPEQVMQMFPNGVLPGQYDDAAIQNSPTLRSLREGWEGMSSYNTGATGGRDFTQAPGVPGASTGLRGGQDVNAGLFLRALPSQREQMQGAIEAQGQYWPDFMEQMQRSSPISDVPVGVAGRRRY